MISKMIDSALNLYSLTIDAETNEEVETLTPNGTIPLFISFLSGYSQTQNNVRTANATHIGITTAKSVVEGSEVEQGGKTYKVDYVNNAPKLSVLYLKEVRAYER